ncbi:MAG: hypothetical protein H6981_06560 [Gammaproteobacteria bacterium]|nr:hypothetical protein [Gammaproteobacteria bacterium]MCP5136445.1 hypothetical protein [Gammaproteobacteria bacterium]
MSNKNHHIVARRRGPGANQVFPIGNYGRIGLAHIERGIPGRPGQHPGYRLYGVHGATMRFPANPEWMAWLHERGVFIAKNKQWFLPWRELTEADHNELKSILEDAVEEWRQVMTKRRDTYFEHRRAQLAQEARQEAPQETQNDG